MIVDRANRWGVVDQHIVPARSGPPAIVAPPIVPPVSVVFEQCSIWGPLLGLGLIVLLAWWIEKAEEKPVRVYQYFDEDDDDFIDDEDDE